MYMNLSWPIQTVCRQRQRHNNNSGNANMTLSDQIMQGALNARKNNPPSSSASSDGNDEAAMAVIMSLLEVSNENLTIYWLYRSCRPLRFIIPSSFSGGCWVRRSGRFQWASLAASLENGDGESCCIAMHWDSKCVKVWPVFELAMMKCSQCGSPTTNQTFGSWKCLARFQPINLKELFQFLLPLLFWSPPLHWDRRNFCKVCKCIMCCMISVGG